MNIYFFKIQITQRHHLIELNWIRFYFLFIYGFVKPWIWNSSNLVVNLLLFGHDRQRSAAAGEAAEHGRGQGGRPGEPLHVQDDPLQEKHTANISDRKFFGRALRRVLGDLLKLNLKFSKIYVYVVSQVGVGQGRKTTCNKYRSMFSQLTPAYERVIPMFKLYNCQMFLVRHLV